MEFFLKHKKYCYLGLLILVMISIGFYIGKSTTKSEPSLEAPNLATNITQEEPIQKCFIDVKGAVKNPGVFEVDCNMIVNDLIKSAGGLKSGGTTTNINLSKKISNEMVIRVFYKKDLTKDNSEINICQSNNIVISNCLESTITENNNIDESTNVGEENATNSNEATTDKIDDISPTNGLISINTATKEELMNLPGIGEAKAINIITYRTEVGSFKDINEILNVSGIGDSIFAQIKALITI